MSTSSRKPVLCAEVSDSFGREDLTRMEEEEQREELGNDNCLGQGPKSKYK